MSAQTVIKPLKKPWKVGGQEATDIEVRSATMADICDAEKEASPLQPNAFNIALATLTVVRAGNFTGPFVTAHFKGMRPPQFNEVVDAMREAEALGED